MTIPELDDPRVLRHVELDGYRLLTWDTGRTTGRGSFAKDAIGYAFFAPGSSTPLFVGEDFGNSPMNAIDSDETLRAILSFLTLRPGDTDAEYFDEYTPEQMDFAKSEAEQLSMWAMEPEEGYEQPAFKNLDDRDEYEENASDMSVANTILEQMGGRRLVAMIGAHSFAGSENSVSFRFKARGKDGINAVRIVLDPSDTYTVEFLSVRGSKWTVKYETSDVYAESLQPLFESKTGLALRL